ncbi:CMGC/CDK/CDC2 protein kinase [Loa loa]|uniref:CMGC/CDK/CDC2 protein kinase n=1 Tax=Loa loa TaxID=7209 RepID=A0A1S0U2N6_LOALO|nr:CMGC/CDK/CDC2 protein kinase [Loa loa]EFO23943.2 CMGC/CDK/CDC2 protein kinase [Loa loa]
MDKSALEKYQRTEIIGEGAYGVVYKGIEKSTGRLVAMKKMRSVHRSEGIPGTALREMTLLKRLKHPNIVSLVEVILDEQLVYLIFEFLSMDLKKCIDKIPYKELMDKAEQKSYLYQILQGICFCHQRNVLHRDLKPQNLLVDGNGTLKIADFGLARELQFAEREYTEVVVTLWYRPPEILFGCTNYTMAVDIWSIGCIFAEMAMKTALFKGDSEIDQIFLIFSILSTPKKEIESGVLKMPDSLRPYPIFNENILPKILADYMDEDGMKILQAMLTYDPKKRISAKKLLKDPYFDDVDRTKLPAGDYDGSAVPPRRCTFLPFLH